MTQSTRHISANYREELGISLHICDMIVRNVPKLSVIGAYWRNWRLLAHSEFLGFRQSVCALLLHDFDGFFEELIRRSGHSRFNSENVMVSDAAEDDFVFQVWLVEDVPAAHVNSGVGHFGDGFAIPLFQSYHSR